jgi:hypothetical protein
MVVLLSGSLVEPLHPSSVKKSKPFTKIGAERVTLLGPTLSIDYWENFDPAQILPV